MSPSTIFAVASILEKVRDKLAYLLLISLVLDVKLYFSLESALKDAVLQDSVLKILCFKILYLTW